MHHDFLRETISQQRLSLSMFLRRSFKTGFTVESAYSINTYTYSNIHPQDMSNLRDTENIFKLNDDENDYITKYDVINCK